MRRVPTWTADEAAARISDSAVVTVSSSSALGCPDAILAALGRRFAETGHPRELTSVHPIAAGDMYGVKGIDHLSAPGQLRRVLCGSFPSGESRLDPPKIRELIADDDIEAYNLPSGVLLQLHRAIAAGQPGVFSEVGLDTFVDPRREGGRMTPSTPPYVEVAEVNGAEYLFYPALNIDVAIVRATTADPLGNLSYEEEGGTLGALDQAYAAHNRGGLVIAQVKRRCHDQLPPRDVHIPGAIVDGIVVAPYQTQTTLVEFDPTLSGTARRDISTLAPIRWGLEKVIGRRAALELSAGSIVNLGFGISATIPHILVEEGVGDAVTWVIEQGAVGGIPLTDFAFGCAVNPMAISQSTDQFTLLQGGGMDMAMLSFLEVSAHGDVNVSSLPSRPHLTAGIGGFADIVSKCRSLVFSGQFTTGSRDIRLRDGRLEIVRDGSTAKFVSAVRQVSSSGTRAMKNGQRVLFVTERCVIALREHGLEIIEIAPGIDLRRDILDRSEIEFSVSPDLQPMHPQLFLDEPMGLELGAPLSLAAREASPA